MEEVFIKRAVLVVVPPPVKVTLSRSITSIMSITSITLHALCAVSLLGCMRVSAPKSTDTSIAPEAPDDGQARCRIAATQENPLVTEWPASEKANLEARLADGAVVVAYSGCSLKMLPNCRVPGSYSWLRTTTATDVVEIRDSDELYAKLPLGAASLEGELARSGRLAVRTTVSGQMRLGNFDPGSVPKDESCQGATHVVSALSIGAFKMHSGGSASAKGSASVGGFGEGSASSAREELTLREAGIPARCEEATPEAPNGQCASPLQIFLRPLPMSFVDRGAPGTIKARFFPVRPNEPWDVVVGDRVVCTTPCDKWVDPSMPYQLKYDPGTFYRNQYWDIPDLRPYTRFERIDVRVDPTKTAELVLGIVSTSIGGLVTATGTALTAIGCSESTASCTAGLITLPIGLAMVGGGIYMMVDSKGEVKISASGQAAASTPLPWREPNP